MAEITHPQSEHSSERFSRQVWRLRLFYQAVIGLADLAVSLDWADPVHDPLLAKANGLYPRLCGEIYRVLQGPGFEWLAQQPWRPYDRLTTLQEGDSEVLGGSAFIKFEAAVDTVFIEAGEKECPLDADDDRLLEDAHACIEELEEVEELRWAAEEADRREKWEREHPGEDYDQAMEEFRKIMFGEHSPETQARDQSTVARARELPDLNFAFVEDQKIKELLARDWGEARKAFQNGLYKCTLVLCGAVIEALLVEALSLHEDAKLAYYEMYRRPANDPRPVPEIYRWGLCGLINVAEHKDIGIISAEAAMLSRYVKDYRNLIHLHRQKRTRLRVTRHVATKVLPMVGIVHVDLVEWHASGRGG